MEDAATAEIARSQVWHWMRHGAKLEDGRRITRELVVAMLDEETARIRADVGEEVWKQGRPSETRDVLEAAMLADELPEFLTLLGYPYLIENLDG